MKLAEFARASDRDYRALQQRIDALPSRQALRFENCELPAGCLPAQATAGFYKESAYYVIFLEGSVRYSGNNRAMTALSGGPHQFFETFCKMKRFFQALPSDSVPAAQPNEITPTQENDLYDLDAVVNMDKISPPEKSVLSIPDYTVIQREMEKQIMGQEKAVATIAHQTFLHISKRSPRRPLSLICHGPTGTGKSETAKALAKILSRLGRNTYTTVWTELNTFTEAHSVYRLTGSPPGYVGYDDAPVFEAAVHNPYTVFIFDELDKAHPEVLKTFMSVLDEGRCAARKELADHSREYDFRRCIFVFTSNFCLGNTANKGKFGFARTDDVENLRVQDSAVEADYREEPTDNSFDTLTQRIYRDTEAARKAFVETGVLREIASRFNCFVEFQELTDEAKIRILAKQVIATGLEYGIKLTHIAAPVMQSLINASVAEDALTVRSYKSVVEGYLAAAFSEAGTRHVGQSVRLEGSIDAPVIISP
ncbi:MAG TPA: hypothetical protein DEQ02_00350 [Ruminococcaceae bacterium]|nr:hypothetical protein [Oscillospiraceae bacterium]